MVKKTAELQQHTQLRALAVQYGIWAPKPNYMGNLMA